MKQNETTTRTSVETAGRRAAALIVGTCLWFGVTAGLAERLLYKFFPGTTGGNDLWYDAQADLLLFSGLAVAMLVVWAVRWRRNLPEITFFFASGLFALDCLFVIWPPFGHRLGQMALLSGGALAIGLLSAALFWRFSSPVVWLGRITLPVLLIYSLVYVGGGAWWTRHQEKRESSALQPRAGAPNVLLIIMDAVGANHLSTYGYGRNTSPQLSELAARGVLFEKAVASSSWTLPSHASMLTGRLPSEHHAGEYDWRLDSRLPTLAEEFRKNGYRTAAFSGNTLLFNRRVGLARGYIHFEDGSLLERLLQTTLGERIQTRLVRANIIDNLAGRQDAREISQDALAWVGRNSGPFFVTLNYFDAHEPLLPPPLYFHRFSSRTAPLKGQYNWPEDVQLSPGEAKDEADTYDACIAYIDQQLSTFLKQLESAGLLRNTIVVVTSDHGQEFQEHGFMFHGKGLYWNLLHAPLLISWPRHVPGGERISTPVALQSLPTTLLSMAGIKNNPFPGPPLSDLWAASTATQAWPAPISELAAMGTTPLFPSYYGDMKSVVTPQWHYVQGGKSGHELYACCDDEQHDLASSSLGSRVTAVFRQLLQQGQPLTQEAMRAMLREHLLRDGMGQRQPLPVASERKLPNRERMNDQLHALGYVR